MAIEENECNQFHSEQNQSKRFQKPFRSFDTALEKLGIQYLHCAT